MQFCKNRNDEYEFYGHVQSDPLNFPFLGPGSNVSGLVRSSDELRDLSSHFKGRIPEDLKLFSLEKITSESLGCVVSDLEEFDPTACNLFIVFSELEDEAERILRQKSLSKLTFFPIAELFRKSSPSNVRQIIRFRGINYSIRESVEIPAYFTNWAYINFLENLITENNYKSVLDMFAGSGAVGFSLSSTMNGISLYSLDANIHAVSAMRETLVNNDNISSTVILSECFGSLRSTENKFDLIVGNPPHMNMPIDYPGHINGRDPNFKIRHEFYTQAIDFLEDGGRIVLVENAFSKVLEDYYQGLPSALKVENIIRLSDNFWDIVIVSKGEEVNK